jgi:hypothetical protein
MHRQGKARDKQRTIELAALLCATSVLAAYFRRQTLQDVSHIFGICIQVVSVVICTRSASSLDAVSCIPPNKTRESVPTRI